ncbi:Ig-like domain-containing protein, partial [Paenibacillus sepulcri]
MKEGWRRSATWKQWNKGVRTALIPIFISGIVFAAGERPAQAAGTVEVNDWASLASAFANSENGSIVHLKEDITQADGTLIVPVGKELTLDLAGKELSITASAGPAVQVEVGAAIIIEDTSEAESGRLIAVSTGSRNGAAGIGGRISQSAGTVTITGGTVEATGSSAGAGIGGGSNANGGPVTITGGKVTARGGDYGAGIGGGYGGGGSGGSAGPITITGGEVTATGGFEAAGIGGGWRGSGNEITIEGGTVTASGGDYGAGIGGGRDAPNTKVTINGGKVTAWGGNQAPGIGGGANGSAGMITITDGEVKATGGSNGAGIGGGIGNTGGEITIKGGTVGATGGFFGAGIGGGYQGDGGTISIEGGTITASGGYYGAGIGGGQQGDGGTISITDGNITANGGLQAAGIGGGLQGSGGDITIEGGTVIPSSGSPNEVSVIGAGSGAADNSFSLDNAGTITIPGGQQLIIPEGVTITNTGTINGNGKLSGSGTIDNTGTIDSSVLGSSAPVVIGNEFVLSFDLNGAGGTPPSSVRVLATSMESAGVTLLPPVTPAGLSFVGWFTESNGGDQWTESSVIGEDITLYAHWIDVSPPTLTLSTTAGNPTNAAFTVTAEFSENVTGFAAGDVTVGNGTLGSFNAESGTKYTFVVTPSADGLVTVDMAGGVAVDAAGNGNTAAAQLSRNYDKTAPTVTLSTTAVNPTNAVFTVTADFSETVTGFAAGDVTVGNGTVGSFNALSGTKYTFVVTPTADGLVTVDVAGGVAVDAAGNGNTAAVRLSRNYDKTAPTVTLSTTAVNPTNAAFTVTAEFSESVTGFAAG